MATWRLGQVRPYGARRGGWRLALPGLLALTLLAGLAQAGGVGATPDRPGNPAGEGGHRALGTVYAWGYDGLGALGDGTVGAPDCGGVCNATPTQSSPNALGDVVAIAAGSGHTLALKADGTVWAWGADGLGQLGDGTVGGGPVACANVCTATPTQIAGLSNVVAIAAGFTHSLALRSDGAVYAWGDDAQGQLGDGTVGPNNPTPTQIATLSAIRAIAAGENHSLALKIDGTVYAWGNDSGGQLGDGTVSTPPSNPTPTQLGGLSDITAITAGAFHSLALKADGTVYAWGLDTEGQLGNGTLGTSNPTPAQIASLSGVAAISAGSRHNLALKNNGTVWSWGWDDAGQLGDGTINPSNPTPTQIGGLSNVTAIAAGRKHNLALGSDGTVRAWGYDNFGALGDGTAGANNPTPAQIAPGTLSGVVAIAAGGDHSLAVAQSSRTLTWGEYGGDTPAIKAGLDNVVAVAGGGTHVLALKADGTVLAWGSDSMGQLGDGTEGSPTSVTTPQAVTGLTNVVAVSAGLFHSLALKTDGTVWAWGNDDNGRLGNGATTGNKATPVQVCAVSACTSYLTGVVAVSAGAFHSLALKADGTVWAWGNDESGQLGNGAAGDQDVPMQVLGVGGVGTLGGIVAISGGGNFSMALGADGIIRTWGDDDEGELGNGAGAPDVCSIRLACAVSPVALSSPTGVVAIDAGTFHGLAVRHDGTVWSWGRDEFGQLGNGAGGSTTSPAQVGGLANMVAVAGGLEHSLALKADGTVWAMGSNRLGQFGERPRRDKLLPGGEQQLLSLQPDCGAGAGSHRRGGDRHRRLQQLCHRPADRRDHHHGRRRDRDVRRRQRDPDGHGDQQRHGRRGQRHLHRQGADPGHHHRRQPGRRHGRRRGRQRQLPARRGRRGRLQHRGQLRRRGGLRRRQRPHPGHPHRRQGRDQPHRRRRHSGQYRRRDDVGGPQCHPQQHQQHRRPHRRIGHLRRQAGRDDLLHRDR